MFPTIIGISPTMFNAVSDDSRHLGHTYRQQLDRKLHDLERRAFEAQSLEDVFLIACEVIHEVASTFELSDDLVREVSVAAMRGFLSKTYNLDDGMDSDLMPNAEFVQRRQQFEKRFRGLLGNLFDLNQRVGTKKLRQSPEPPVAQSADSPPPSVA